jgi:hypothetical protein
MKALFLFVALIFFSNLSAAGKPLEADCINCSGKLTTTVKPDIDVALSLKKDLATPKGVSRGLSSEKPLELKVKGYVNGCSSKRCYEMVMCDKFYLAKDRWDVEEMFDLIPTMPAYNKVDDYFFMVECSPKGYNQNIGIKAPMIHLIIDDASKRQDYLEAIFEMYDLSGEGAKLTQILNLKSNRGETFLDYLYFVRRDLKTSMTDGMKKAFEKVFKYACEKGAEFSKFKTEANCSKPISVQVDK